MAAKKIKSQIKLEIAAGAANPAPPVGPALGQHGVNIQEFCSSFNAQTQDKKGDIIPVEITIYEDRTFSLVFKEPPVASLILKAANIQKGSANPLNKKAGKITKEQVKEIAQRKMVDLNANDAEAAMKIVEGTAKSMGIDIA
jgi:large subunit ribosomal protein L11